jgi:hypothetical protein
MNKSKSLNTGRKKKNYMPMIISASVYAVGITILCTLYKPALPIAEKMKKAEIIDFVASKRFAELSVEKQEEYVKYMRPQTGGARPPQMFRNMNPAKREAVRRNMRKIMQKRMREWVKKFSMMTRQEQDKFLDKLAEEMKKRRPPSEGGNGSGPRPPRGNPQAMFESTDSTTRAQMHEMHERLRERLQQQRN